MSKVYLTLGTKCSKEITAVKNKALLLFSLFQGMSNTHEGYRGCDNGWLAKRRTESLIPGSSCVYKDFQWMKCITLGFTHADLTLVKQKFVAY